MAEVKNICLEALERHCESGDTGRLDFHRDTYEGQIFVHERLIVHAQLSNLEGIPAMFRLFDWGDAETTWQPGIASPQETLHLTMGAASLLYAENLQVRAELDAKEKEKVDQSLSTPEAIAGSTLGVESVLKHYTVSLECTETALLPDGFTFADAAKSSYVIGSSDDCDVILRHPTVDALHCGVILERGSVFVWDLGANSGVKINGRAIAEDKLKVGDVMTLGSLDLRVRFQLRRPRITAPLPDPKAKTVPGAAPTTSGGTTVAVGTPEEVPAAPKLSATQKMVPKGAITYDKVVKQLKGKEKGVPFLNKLGSLFGAKKDK